MTSTITRTQTNPLPPNGNPGIVPPWLQGEKARGGTVVHTNDEYLDWRQRRSGSYPVPEPLTVYEVQEVLASRGLAEFRCDELPARG